MSTVMLIYLGLSAAFFFGFITRGLFALGDIRELDELRAVHSARDAEVALLKRMADR